MDRDRIHFVSKGWGYEKWIVNNEKYCGKILHFVKGRRCSFHFHKLKDETFYLLSGKLMLRYGFDQNINKAAFITLRPGDRFHIPVGLCHQMEAFEDSELLEFSTQHFDEDSYRIVFGD